VSKRKVTPLGPALDTPDEDLDILALITPEDIELAKADSVGRAAPRGRALLNAERADQTPPESD
jgi:hypothetical protein